MKQKKFVIHNHGVNEKITGSDFHSITFALGKISTTNYEPYFGTGLRQGQPGINNQGLLTFNEIPEIRKFKGKKSLMYPQ
jgi:hypothetical protein